MCQRKCYVCEKILNTNVNESERETQCKSICAECSKIAFAVTVAMIEINRKSRTRPSTIRVSEVVEIISKDNFMRGLQYICPPIKEIVKDLANPVLRRDYLNKGKINRCFDFFEEAEDLVMKQIGKSSYEERQKQSYDFIKSFRNVKEFILEVLSSCVE